MILALDTTSEFGSIALVKSGQLLGEQSMQSPDGFGHVLFTELELFLARRNVTLEWKAVDALPVIPSGRK